MATVNMERKLAAILSADVTGYSRLMTEDEESTVRTLLSYRQVIYALIEQNRGRTVDSPGDNVLAEFASIVDALRAAMAIQRELRVRNAELAPHRRMEFRIGINLGDVIVDGERIYGDGINIAARLEAMAEPGGICISGTAYDQVENKLALTYVYEGEHTVKNIAKPVRVYRVRAESAGQSARVKVGRKSPIQMRRRAVVAVASLLVMVASGLISWQLVRSPAGVDLLPSREATALPLPDKPSIAVLPFHNLSQDPEQEYFSDGITEDLITALSRISGLFVIARRSTFTYKGKDLEMAQVSRDLGVRYVLNGSVRQADGRVRVTVRLVDAIKGYHLWAERYDRDLQGIFALQDDITRKIVASLAVKLNEGEEQAMARSYTDNQLAWDNYVRARELFRQGTKEANRQARDLLNKAIVLDSKFARAYATLAATHRRDWIWAWGDDPAASQQLAEAAAQQAVTLDDRLPHGHKQLAMIYVYQRRHDEAIEEARMAVQLDENDADNHAVLAEVLNYAGEFAQAIDAIQTAMRLDPFHSAHYPYVLGQAYYLLGEHQKAEDALARSFHRNPKFMPARAYRAAVYMALNRPAEAGAEMREIRKVIPTPARQRRNSAPFKDPEITRHLHDTWRMAEESSTSGEQQH